MDVDPDPEGNRAVEGEERDERVDRVDMGDVRYVERSEVEHIRVERYGEGEVVEARSEWDSGSAGDVRPVVQLTKKWGVMEGREGDGDGITQVDGEEL